MKKRKKKLLALGLSLVLVACQPLQGQQREGKQVITEEQAAALFEDGLDYLSIKDMKGVSVLGDKQVQEIKDWMGQLAQEPRLAVQTHFWSRVQLEDEQEGLAQDQRDMAYDQEEGSFRSTYKSWISDEAGQTLDQIQGGNFIRGDYFYTGAQDYFDSYPQELADLEPKPYLRDQLDPKKKEELMETLPMMKLELFADMLLSSLEDQAQVVALDGTYVLDFDLEDLTQGLEAYQLKAIEEGADAAPTEELLTYLYNFAASDQNPDQGQVLLEPKEIEIRAYAQGNKVLSIQRKMEVIDRVEFTEPLDEAVDWEELDKRLDTME